MYLKVFAIEKYWTELYIRNASKSFAIKKHLNEFVMEMYGKLLYYINTIMVLL